MSRDHSHSHLGRGCTGTRNISRAIIYVEGKNTEYSYCNLLKNSCSQLIPIVEKGHGIGSCIEFVEEANKKFDKLSRQDKAKYSQKWLMFDCDGHQDFAESVKLARRYGFHVVFSNMCIEYWFVLHFYNHNGSPIPMKGDSHSKAHIEMINNYIRQYNKNADGHIAEYNGNSKRVEEDFFDLMLSVDPQNGERRIINAFNRAEAIHLKKKIDGAEFQESVTTMYEFLKSLGVIRKGKGGAWTFDA